MTRAVAWLLILSAPFFASAQTIQSSICTPLTTPIIVTPMAGEQLATSTAHVTGAADHDATVILSANGTPYATILVDASGNFTADLVDLPSGAVTLRATAVNPCEQKPSSDVPITIPTPTHTPEPPILPPIPATPPSSPTHGANPQTTRPVYRFGTTNPAATTDEPASPTQSPPALSSAGILSVTLYDVTENARVTTTTSPLMLKGEMSSPGTIEVWRSGIRIAMTAQAASTFSLGIALEAGDNEFDIVARSGSSEARTKLHVTYQPSVAAVLTQKRWERWPIVVGATAIIGIGGVSWLVARRRHQNDD